MWIHIIEVLIHIKINHIYYTHRYNICAIVRLFGLFSLISFYVFHLNNLFILQIFVQVLYFTIPKIKIHYSQL